MHEERGIDAFARDDVHAYSWEQRAQLRQTVSLPEVTIKLYGPPRSMEIPDRGADLNPAGGEKETGWSVMPSKRRQ
jgi:hypothetical protein